MSEKLRDAMEEIQKILPKKDYSWQHIREPHRMLRSIATLTEQALSEAGDEPEMVRLLRWLEKKERWAKKRSQRYGKNFPNLRMTAETNAGGYRNVIEEIKDTFGYTLPKEEYVDRDSDDLDLDEMADHKLW